MINRLLEAAGAPTVQRTIPRGVALALAWGFENVHAPAPSTRRTETDSLRGQGAVYVSLVRPQRRSPRLGLSTDGLDFRRSAPPQRASEPFSLISPSRGFGIASQKRYGPEAPGLRRKQAKSPVQPDSIHSLPIAPREATKPEPVHRVENSLRPGLTNAQSLRPWLSARLPSGSKD